MKRLRPLLILAGSAVVLGIILWVLVAFVLPKDETGEEKGNSVVLMETNLTEADSIEIKNAFDTYILTKEAIGSYYIEGKKGYKVNSASVVELLKELGSLTATKKVIDAPSEEQLKSYGLKTPFGTLKVKDDDKTYGFSFGTTSSSGNYYLQMEGDPAVYLIDSTVPDVALLARYQFYTNTLIEYTGEADELEKLTDIKIGGKEREQEIVIEMNILGDDEVGTSYMMTAPIYQSFSGAIQDSLNELMIYLGTSTVVGDDTGDAALKKFGLDDPSYILTYVLDEETVEVHFGKVNDSGYRYCYVPGGKFVHYIPETYTECLGKPLKSYCEDMIYTRAADTLSHVTISGSGKTFEIAVGEKDEEGNFYVTINNKQVDSELFSDFYAHILTIGITDLGQKGEEQNSYLDITFTLKNGTKEYMKFYSVSELKCFVELNGKGNFWVSTLNVDKILSNAQKLYDGDVISLEW